jgi:hypothetical protein
MTIEELKETAARALQFAIERLQERGDLAHMLHLVRRSGGIEIIGSTAEVTNSEKSKGELAKILRERMAVLGDVEAVIMISDVFWAELTPAQEKMMRVFGFNVEQAAAAGLCEKFEAIMVTLESPILYQMAKQKYTHSADGRAIMLDGAPEITDDTGNTPRNFTRFTGRFTHLFDHGAGARS